MFEYIKGELVDLTPTSVVVETNGIGYYLNISLNTYSKLSGHKNAQVYLHQVVREDAHLLFGFIDASERSVFRHLISVSGVGANTARMMLSSLTPSEIQTAIVSSNVKTLQGVKGIGAKSAQRLIIELKDKLGKDTDIADISFSQNNTTKDEALSALVMLGFAKNSVTKVIDKLFAANPSASVEDLIKLALKQL
ncbi:Holliday junction branch migration protein RuvA [Labilibaculum sp. DW002]|uniref:Holliday junction branch migration complex subunit RuvA n=1 Tax=Paralabilibaculum antarcticum TaxID=2912572 RepID=A0ABT5VVB9_9BACT|nr:MULTISPECIES: Holliday junction branch migration protein RuvA [unclassified Labilibaculum]MBI9057712.1 Holliday junction branch migration protein RuvA [Labilibaculum sp.]MDE5419359.1 Holliday junction branch migration protein RuvA [Labilibaculum sp. DW002]